MTYLLTGVVYKVNVPARARDRLQTFGGRVAGLAKRGMRREGPKTPDAVDSSEAGANEVLDATERRFVSLKTGAQTTLSQVKDKAAQAVTAQRDNVVATARDQTEAAADFARKNSFLLVALALTGALVALLVLLRTKEDEGNLPEE